MCADKSSAGAGTNRISLADCRSRVGSVSVCQVMGEPLEVWHSPQPGRDSTGVSKSTPPPTGLGLRRGTVALAEYSPSWRVAFREERVILAKALASVPCEIEHIGSTAVPGLEAKPILDIAVGVGGSYPIEDCFPAIEAAGYIYRGEVVDASHLLVRGSEDQVRTHTTSMSCA